jgi:tetratricopeptide (TPR) repeat protein
MGRSCVWLLLFSALLTAKSPDCERAREAYQRTQYRESLGMLLPIAQKDAATFGLIGQNYFMIGEYKKATEALEKAIRMEPSNSGFIHWLGRTYGRRAEMGGPFTAPGYAFKAGQMFEKSVVLDPSNKGATGDLLDFYLDAPGFLGGGMHKAEQLAAQIARTDPAEGHYALAQIEEKRKDYSSAEQHLRRAQELAPSQAGRAMDLAMFLAKRGRFNESESMFDQAARMAPDNAKFLFERADTYIKEQRNLAEAKQLLQRYLRAQLTPDDPPRERAASLLKKIGA